MRSVMQHQFSQAPSADIQRSSFNRSHGHKTTFDAGLLIPVFVDEALPGDTFTMNTQMFARLATPLHPVMDNMFLDIHYFSVPMRQLWDNFRKFMGEQVNPGDSTDYTMPTLRADTDAHVLYESTPLDYFGLPLFVGVGSTYGTSAPNALFFRAYNHIYNEWYRDQNLIDSAPVPTGDGPDDMGANYPIRRRGKRHDYFTSSLLWPQKGDSVDLPLGQSADVAVNKVSRVSNPGEEYGDIEQTDGTGGNPGILQVPVAQAINGSTPLVQFEGTADLSTATASTINQLRQAFQIQKLLERDARSGTRYAEIVQAHFGVQFHDPSYRPEYLGGSSSPVMVHPVPQTSNTVEGSTPQGNLAAFGTVSESGGGFTKSFTEHCIVMGIASVRADLTYQQGINRMFSRSTRYDYYWPALAHIGEQAVLSKEIYFNDEAADDDVFGYQERFAEYKYKPSIITGQFRSKNESTLDSWHLSQEFTTRPVLGKTFIEENPPVDRVIEVSTEPHFIADFYFNLQCARPMPLFSVPGLIDHF